MYAQNINSEHIADSAASVHRVELLLTALSEGFTHKVCSLLILLALMVKRDQVCRQTMVKLLVLGVQHQENQVKPVAIQISHERSSWFTFLSIHTHYWAVPP